jgi:hypothetical protein
MALADDAGGRGGGQLHKRRAMNKIKTMRSDMKKDLKDINNPLVS